MADKHPRQVNEWPSVMQKMVLTREQKNRVRKGESMYERDRVIEDYKFSKGKWI